MPTGYTADIEKDITFEQYAWSCARAFGALVLMRDDPADAPIPEKFEPSDYHQKAITEAKGELALLNAMMPHEVQEAAQKEFKDSVKSYRERLEKKVELRKKYNAMLDKCKAFIAPTPDHEEYKKFMIEQIESSIKFDCGTNYMEKPEQLSPEVWLANKISKANRDIAYHTEEHTKEVDRTNKRNEWIQSLRKALA